MSEPRATPTDAKAIFLSVCDLAPGERAAELDRRAAHDARLRTAVLSLLEAHDCAGQFLRDPTVGTIEPPAPPLERHIGPYKILQEIGEGGFGTVYMAEQEHPVRRRVALKLIKVGMDTRSVIARFEAERQALALMDHPNIARVYDAGQTDDGRPYFVMELVKGVPITEYCDHGRLGIRQRLDLFAQVCHAVQHAHQKGLIHRDIKPTNVLVSTADDKPLAKVIDFGIAKATQARLTEKTLFTEFRQLVGTPEYMSPEQAEGSLDIDTRTDVYALGVLLYELLTGTTPFDARDLRSKAYAEMQRLIREVEPPKPSTRILHMRETIASVAAQRGVEPRRLNTLLRGELDWIVMRALEKDRARRYETANALAADVQRYLGDEAVSAGPPSKLYRMRKFARRHRGPMIASAVVLAVLVAGVIGTTIGLIGQARARAIAERNANIAEAVNDFQADMLRSADPGRMMGDKVTVAQALIAAIKELDGGKLKGQALVESHVRGTIGETLRGLGRFDEAERQHRKSLELRRGALRPDDWLLVDPLSCLATALQDQGKLDEAEALLREALSICRAALKPGDPITEDTLVNVGHLRELQGLFAEAEPMYREALDSARRATPPRKRDVATALNNIAHALQGQGRLAEAEPLYREALDLLRQVQPPGHPLIGASVNNVGILMLAQGRYADAEAPLREALDIRRKVLPAGHTEIAAGLNNLGGCLKNLGKLDEAEQLYREALDLNRAALPPGHPHIATTINNLARLLQVAQKYDEAERLMRESLAMRRAALPAGHPDIAQSLGNLGELLAARGRPEDAEPYLRESLAAYASKFGNDNAQVGGAHLRLGRALLDLRHWPDAEGELREARRILAGPAGDRAARALVDLYTAWDQAEPGQGFDAKARAAAAATTRATTQTTP